MEVFFVKFMDYRDTDTYLTNSEALVDKTIAEKFGNKVRVRICGLCRTGDRLLMVNHRGLYGHDFWAPPGGGLAWGERAENALEREFMEETGLKIRAGELKFVCEFIGNPFHAIELFFDVTVLSGEPTLGSDPELADGQVIEEVKYLTESEIKALPAGWVHGRFQGMRSLDAVLNERGFYTLGTVQKTDNTA